MVYVFPGGTLGEDPMTLVPNERFIRYPNIPKRVPKQDMSLKRNLGCKGDSCIKQCKMGCLSRIREENN